MPPQTGASIPTVEATNPLNVAIPAPVNTIGMASEEQLAFELLNAERQKCGFGGLTKNSALDTAAKGHAEWLLLNPNIGHFQVVGTRGFTGASPADRLVTAKYTASGLFDFDVGESAASTRTDKEGRGIIGVRGLLNAPYHAMGMLRGYRDLGMSVRSNKDIGLATPLQTELVMDFANTLATGTQKAAAGTVRSYPCEGSTGIDWQLKNEAPNPVPGRDLVTQPLGSSISVQIDEGHTLVISSATMVNDTSKASIVMHAPIVKASDPNKGDTMLTNEGFISADAPLTPLTKYQVTITGKDNGVDFKNISFTFTTGK